MSAAEKIDDDLEVFRAEARKWLEANFPPSLKGKGGMMVGEGGGTSGADFGKWKKAMGDKGWGTPTWPTQYGGGGLTQKQARVLQQEMARIGASRPIGGMGVMMFGPTLLEYGSEEQKKRHAPGIIKGEVWWCQGYSEPGAGSDLASLRTHCERQGRSLPHQRPEDLDVGRAVADWCFCLVRTDTTKKHEGISFVLIDMKTPGVEARPIKLISGCSPFCETFFTDVKVPKEHLSARSMAAGTSRKRLLQYRAPEPRRSCAAGFRAAASGARAR